MSSGERSRPLVSVGICTFRRPALLVDLVAHLAPQLGAVDQVVVVDNDPDHEAITVLPELRRHLGDRLELYHLPQPNIALARNAVIAHARHDLLLLIDDDERPAPGWVDAMWSMASATHADAVCGPVVARIEGEIPAWLVASGVFDRPRHPSGSRLSGREGRTGNVLLQRACLVGSALADGVVFDPAFGRTGGEDQDLFLRLERAGCRLVWCDEAVVSEAVAVDRRDPRWHLRRAFRTGQIDVRTRGRHWTGWPRGMWMAGVGLRALAVLLFSCAGSLAWRPLSRARSFAWRRWACHQAGRLSGLAGGRVEAYG